MTTEAPLPKDHPIMIAWEKYKASDQYANAFQWAQNVDHRDGSMWNAFLAGFDASYSKPLSPAPVGVTEDQKIKFALQNLALANEELRMVGGKAEPVAVNNIGYHISKAVEALASHEPAPTDTQEGVSEAGEVERLQGILAGANKVITGMSRDFTAAHDAYQSRILELETDLEVANDKLRVANEALEPFALVAEYDIGEDEGDEDIFWPISNTRYAMALRVGHLRRARAVLGGQSNEA